MCLLFLFQNYCIMKSIILSGLFLFILSISVFAQKTIKGKVFDANTKSALSGATISFSGKGGTTSDAAGMFSIDCSKTTTITISFVGYQNYTHVVRNCNDDLQIGLTSSSQNLNEVEITATSNQNKSILYQPQAITKLTATELKRGNGLFLDDAINTNVPGVTMNRRTVSGGQQINIRGYGNGSRGTRGVSSNFDGQGYKLYLNGIPVTDAEGITTMDDIDFSSIGNVEVVKGPAGSLYGLAIAGAVNLHTLKPLAGTTSVGQDILIGNYGLQRYTTHFAMGSDHSSLLVNYGYQKSDGFTIHNNSHKNFVNLAGDFQPNTKQAITSYFGYSNSYDERSGELTIGQYDTSNFSGNIDYIKRDGHSNVITYRGGLGHTYFFTKNISNTTTIFGTSFASNVSSAGGWTDKLTTNAGIRSTVDTKFNLSKNFSLSGITGIEMQRQDAQTVGYSMKQAPNDPRTTGTWTWGDPYWVVNTATSNVAAISKTSSYFTEWTLAMPFDISLTAGIGVSNMKIRLKDRFNTATITKPSQFDTAYKNLVSPHFALNKVFNKKISVYVSYSRGYKAPVSSYFYIVTPAVTTPLTPSTGRVNSVLKTEIGDQFEIGTKGSLLKDRLSYQFAFYDAVFKNKMTAVAVPLNNTTTAYTYMVNAGKQDNIGVEASIKYTVFKSEKGFFSAITPFFNFTYSDFKYKDYKYQLISGKTTSLPLKDSIVTVDYSNNPVAGVAKVVTSFGVDVTTKPGLYANINYFYKDGMTITGNGTDNGLPAPVGKPYHARSYSLLNAKVGFQRTFAKHFGIDAYFGVNNITNTKYPIMIFVNQPPDAYIAGPANANYFGGLNLKYNF